MSFIQELIMKSAEQVVLSLIHNWPYLLLSVVIAVLLRRSVDAKRISAFLKRHPRAGVVAATAAAVGTPLCSCGTTAVVLGMMAGSLPWAPIVAFMAASPLTSPEGLVYSAGLFGWPFAIAFFVASILIGLAGGWVASVLEARGWLANQTRFATSPVKECGCSPQPGPTGVEMSRPDRSTVFSVPTAAAACGCGGTSWTVPVSACGCADSAASAPVVRPSPLSGMVTFATDFFSTGRQLVLMFVGFAFIGFVLNGLIPSSWVSGLFGSGNVYSVPLAATLALPLYINGEASLPLLRGLLDAGMSQGVALAFLIAGAGTSVGAVTGALAIARWRVIALVIAILWLGAILSGYAFDLALSLGIF